MTNTRILSISITAMLFTFTLVGCAEKGVNSSYDNNSAQWQQNKSKQAVDNIDK